MAGRGLAATIATPSGAAAAPAESRRRQPEGRARSPWRDLLLLNAALGATLALFLGKAFTIDDPAQLVEEKLVFAPWVASVASAMAAHFYVSKDVFMPFAFGRGAVDAYQVGGGGGSFGWFGPSKAEPAVNPRRGS